MPRRRCPVKIPPRRSCPAQNQPPRPPAGPPGLGQSSSRTHSELGDRGRAGGPSGHPDGSHGGGWLAGARDGAERKGPAAAGHRQTPDLHVRRVAEGFSPGVLDKWVSASTTRGRSSRTSFRRSSPGWAATAPTAGSGRWAFAGLWRCPAASLSSHVVGYSYLDWLGVYSFGLAMLSALHIATATRPGRGSGSTNPSAKPGSSPLSPTTSGNSILAWSANGREWRRYGYPVAVQARRAARHPPL